MKLVGSFRGAVRLAACIAVAAVGVVVPHSSALADTWPAAGTPATVSADPLPTVQVDGVVWSQVVVGNTVYAAGSFKNVRPAFAYEGHPHSSVRNNLLAYDITTGKLVTTFVPDLNGQALAVAASPDGKRLYVGGQVHHRQRKDAIADRGV